MKKEKADLEQLLSKLLNDLVRMWWKPFNRDKTLHIDCYDKCKWLNYKWVHLDGWFMNEENRTLRELVSIDSWLWQFVCENGMVDKQHWYIEELKWWKADDDEEWHDNWEERYSTEYQFRLIESSLKDESELEDFLLQSIVINKQWLKQ